MNNLMLAVPVFLPIITGIVILADHAAGHERAGEKGFNVFLFLACLANSLCIFWLLFNARGDELVLFYLYGNMTVKFHLDGMGSVFAGLIAFLWPLAMLYSFEYMEHERKQSSFFAFYILTYGVTAGIALSGNYVTMYLFYELLTLVTFPLVLYPQTREAVRASRKYLYYSIGGAAFAFVGLVFVLSFSATGNTEFLPGGVLDMARAKNARWLLEFVYVLAFFGFGVKAALFPVHGWLPRATVAPTPVTALLHAVAVVKSGAFAIMRLTYFCYGTEFLSGSMAQYVVMAAAMFTLVFGSTCAVKELHWKRRLAYSTISNLSYILFSVSLMSPFGLAAGMLHMVVHAFMKICSFFCAGAVMHRTGKIWVWELDGMAKKMPVTFLCLTTASFSLIGMPLFGGFVSKWNIISAAMTCFSDLGNSGGASWLPMLGVGCILYSALMTCIYMFTVLQRAYFPNLATGREACEKNEGTFDKCDPGPRMLVPLCIFAVIIVLLGTAGGGLAKWLGEIGGEIG